MINNDDSDGIQLKTTPNKDYNTFSGLNSPQYMSEREESKELQFI